MRRLKRFFVGFLMGSLAGAIIGALGGTMDRGSMFVLVPSGPPFWAIVGAFVGSIVGALYGALSSSSSQDVTSLTSGGLSERSEKCKAKERLRGNK